MFVYLHNVFPNQLSHKPRNIKFADFFFTYSCSNHCLMIVRPGFVSLPLQMRSVASPQCVDSMGGTGQPKLYACHSLGGNQVSVLPLSCHTLTVTTTRCEALAQLSFFFTACWVFSCFRNPPNHYVVDYRIINVRTWSLMCVRIHTGVGLTDSESAHFWLGKNSRFFLVLLKGYDIAVLVSKKWYCSSWSIRNDISILVHNESYCSSGRKEIILEFWSIRNYIAFLINVLVDKKLYWSSGQSEIILQLLSIIKTMLFQCWSI